METLFYLYLITTTSLLVKNYTHTPVKKKKLKQYLLFICTVWLSLLTLYLFHSSPNLVDVNETRLELLFFVLFALFNTFLLIYLRMLFNNSYWYLLLLLPVSILFYFNLLIFNKPSYNGAMDGFAFLMDFYIMQKILITFPLFVFTFSMTKCPPKIKGISLILFVIVTGVIGIMQSVGREGYLADGSGQSFAVMLLILAAVAAHSLFQKAKHHDTFTN